MWSHVPYHGTLCPTRAFGEHIQKAHNMQLESEYEDWKASMKAMVFEKRQRTLSSLTDIKQPKVSLAVIKLRSFVVMAAHQPWLRTPTSVHFAEGKYPLLTLSPMIIGVPLPPPHIGS
eukprot:PhM_4_TR15932/c1_g1_i8/m.163